MLANNNQKVIHRMAKHTLKNSGKNYIILGIAVFLSTFMLFSVFTLGCTYLDMQKRQVLRLHGGDYDAAVLNGYSEKQKIICEKFKNVISVGSTCYGGYPLKTDKAENLHYAFIYADPVFWNLQMAPARTSLKGHYPVKENELMVTKEALKDCGMENLTLGDSFSLTYKNPSGEYTKDFVISGIWEGYGPKDFYVSKALLDNSGYKMERYGILYLKFKNFIITKKEQKRLNEELNLSLRQSVSFSGYKENSVSVLTGLLFITIVTCLSAYLLVYNILHLSIQGNIRYFGLLFTLGMTKKQLHRFLNLKLFLVGSLSIFAGLFTALITSFFLIPKASQALGLKASQVVINFNPYIFAGTIGLVSLTIYLGNKKPVKTASNISPMEALRFRNAPGKKNFRKKKGGTPLSKMAWEQIIKDMKKTSVTITSLSLCLTVFLCLCTVIKSQDAQNLMTHFMNSDLIISNNTQSSDNPQEWNNVLTDAVIKKISSLPGVTQVNPLVCTKITVPWEEDFAELWMKSMNEFFMDEPYEETLKKYKSHPENYYSFIEGINENEFDALNKTLETPMDKESFLQGKSCILSGAYVLGEHDVTGKNVTCLIDGQNNAHTFQIASALYDGSYSMHTAGGPVIVVSDNFIKANSKKALTIQLNVFYQNEFDEETEGKILNILYENSRKNDFSLDSKIENLNEIKEAQGNMSGVGIGITFIFALIGIMNYINTIASGIQNRKVTLAVMESIGMSRKQTDKMLILEGMFYAGISWCITATFGFFLTYFIYQSVNYQGIPFSLPLPSVVGMTLLLFGLCMIVPPAAYRAITGKESIVERIHGFE